MRDWQAEVGESEILKFVYRLRDMLTVIMGRAQFLEFSARDPGRLHRTVDAIVEAVKSIDSEACALLASMPSPGQGSRTEAVDIPQLIKGVIESLGDPARQQVRIVSPGDRQNVVGDPAQLIGVFSDIIANVLRSAGPNSTVTVDIAPRDGEILVAVAGGEPGRPSGDGLGLSCGQMGSLEAGQRGLNLGFWVAKRIVEAHGGQVWVTGGNGAVDTFFVSLPR